MQAGSSAVVFPMEVRIFQIGRAYNQRTYWGLPQFYTLFRMSAYKRIRSNWIAKAKARWENYLVSATGCSLLCYSAHGNAKQGSVGDDRSGRCMAMLSASTLGVLLLVMRWAFTSREVGGLTEECNRQASQDFFGTTTAPLLSRPEPLVI